jgi:regulator of nucleoside diphosphate kinase
MSMETYRTRRPKPRITLSADDYERLMALANGAMNRAPDLAAELVEEIGRAHVVAAGRVPQEVVCMNSEVEFRDESNGKVQRLILVYPNEADISEGKLSVLTPVGTALIGVRVGDSIGWETPSGEFRRLTVLSAGEPQT